VAVFSSVPQVPALWPCPQLGTAVPSLWVAATGPPGALPRSQAGCTLARSASGPPLPPLQFLEGLLTEAYPVVKKAVGGTSSLAGRLNLRVSGV
jgi:hypothetical protein